MVFDGKSKITQNAYIIEWLDSVGIYVVLLVRSVINENNFSYDIQQKNDRLLLVLEWFKTRQLATESAIKKAVEIYNANN